MYGPVIEGGTFRLRPPKEADAEGMITWFEDQEVTAWGRGIAGEMMRLRAAYAFTALPLHKLKSGYIEGNVASGRAQAAAGYREVGRLRQERFRQGRWHDFIVTELMRADWERGQRSGPTGTPT